MSSAGYRSAFLNWNKSRTKYMPGLFARVAVVACLAFTATVSLAQTKPAAAVGSDQTKPAAAVASAQTKPAFEVASIKASPPLDVAKIAAGLRDGQMPRLGPRVVGTRAEYIYMSLRDLIVLAYNVKPYQITGPAWIASQRFDITAKLPDGAIKDDVPKMLQSMLEERFKLALHRESKEHPVLALIVGKGGPKMKESTEAPKPIDPDAPLGPGERKIDGPDGPVRMTVNKTGGFIMNMGEKGTMTYSIDPATRSMKMEASHVTMSGFADMLSALGQMTGAGLQVKDMTGLAGHYEVAITFSMEELMAMAQNMARATGIDLPTPPAGAGAAVGPAEAASEPSGSTSLYHAVEAMGLKLESRKATVEQLVIDRIEKTPTEN